MGQCECTTTYVKPLTLDLFEFALQAYPDKNADLAVSVLQTMQRYISWIDISLVANPK